MIMVFTAGMRSKYILVVGLNFFPFYVLISTNNYNAGAS